MKLIESIDTKISDKWGVHWSKTEYIRDFYQNFYDANPKKDIKILTKDSEIEISAPNAFDWQELIILGSDKGDREDTIGQYGEGFKAALLNAMRDGLYVNVSVEPNVFLEFRFEETIINKRKRNLIFCDRYRLEENVVGCKLSLSNVIKEHIDIAKKIPEHFFSTQNKCLGKIIDFSSNIAVYDSTLKNNGYLYYNNLLRAELNLPINIIFTKKYKSIDRLIEHDRDRKAFNDKVLNKAYSLFSTKFSSIATTRLVNHWDSKNRLISSMVSKLDMYSPIALYAEFYQEQGLLDQFAFDKYNFIESYFNYITFFEDPNLVVLYIKKHNKIPKILYWLVTLNNDWTECTGFRKDRLKLLKNHYCNVFSRDLLYSDESHYYKTIEDSLENSGLKKVSAAFNRMSVINATSIMRIKELIRKYSSEKVIDDNHEYSNRLEVLKLVTVIATDRFYSYEGLYPEYDMEVKIIENNTEVTALFEPYKGVINLTPDIFKMKYDDAVSIFIHEWCHQFGNDGNRIFSDALTKAISGVINHALEIRCYEEFWRNNLVPKIRFTDKKWESFREQLELDEKEGLVIDTDKIDFDVDEIEPLNE